MKTKTKTIIEKGFLTAFLTSALGVCVWIIVTFSGIFYQACSAQQVKSSLRHGNMLAAKSLVAVYQESYDWLETEEGTYQFCKSELCDSKTEDELIANCEHKMAEFEAEFDRILTSTSLSLQVFEHAIDTWDSIDADEKLGAIGDVLTGLKDLERLLREAGVDVPAQITEAMSWIEMIGNTLKDQ